MPCLLPLACLTVRRTPADRRRPATCTVAAIATNRDGIVAIEPLRHEMDGPVAATRRGDNVRLVKGGTIDAGGFGDGG